jgi:hypothetical protein
MILWGTYPLHLEPHTFASPSDFQMRQCHLANSFVLFHVIKLHVLIFKNGKSGTHQQ